MDFILRNLPILIMVLTPVVLALFLMFISVYRTFLVSGQAERRQAKFSKRIMIAALMSVTVISGHVMSAQLALSDAPLASLKTVAVPEPDNLKDFVQDKVAAIALGKTLFWDMQVGSDGNQSCASCHFHAGTDSRSKNTLNPGFLRVNADRKSNPDGVFSTGGGPNYQLKPQDFPFHKLENPADRFSKVVADSNDIAGSQGEFNNTFVSNIPGSSQDKVILDKDQVFNVKSVDVRQVTARNAPSIINAIFNYRNFWDGRAQNEFNGSLRQSTKTV